MNKKFHYLRIANILKFKTKWKKKKQGYIIQNNSMNKRKKKTKNNYFIIYFNSIIYQHRTRHIFNPEIIYLRLIEY